MIKNVVAVIALVGAAVLSGGSLAQAEGLGAPGLYGQVGAAPAGLSDPGDREVDWYDCSDKDDGNYAHPTDNTKFMSCVARRHAYERNCPQGQHFDPDARECD